ncbi:CHAP domain-containing protein [Kutzneria sp. 744]|uniref:CHAP domain-containing protein n=1 Tax=Kutzneria sp. (strain 744) TaxID=345341 RepID=UPI0003EED616|nr:CHAP domain-containing protein [Kutzneria sp. 744]EWM18841.1 mucin-2 [Kutzneria sp. 744]
MRIRLPLLAAVVTLGTAMIAATPADAAGAEQHHTYLRTVSGWNYVSTEAGWTDSQGRHAKNVLRARSTIPGPYEGYQIRHLSGMPAGAVALWSDVAQAYVTAEFSWAGRDRGTLHARPGQTTVGPWETFYQVQIGTSGNYPVFTLKANDSSGGSYYVSADQGSNYPGDLQGVLQADQTVARDGEHWAEGPGPQNLVTGDDYPWRYAAFDPAKNPPSDFVDAPTRGGFQYARECDSFVAWKIYENSGGRQYTQIGGPGGTPTDYRTYSVDINGGNPGMGPDAKDWANNATRYNSGFWVDQTPTPGAVAQWNANSGGMAGFGHVAYVDKVNSDGSIVVENFNLTGNGEYSVNTFSTKSATVVGNLTFSWPSNFVHIHQFH